MTKEVIKTETENTTSEVVIKKSFQTFIDQASEWKEKAYATTITSLDQKKEMKECSIARKTIKKIRVEASHLKNKLKKDALIYVDNVQKAFNEVENLTKPIEAHLQIQEDFKKNELARLERERIEEEKERLSQLKIARDALIVDLADYLPVLIQDIELFSDEQFEDILNLAKEKKVIADNKAKELEERKRRDQEAKERKEKEEKVKREQEEKEKKQAKEKKELQDKIDRLEKAESDRKKKVIDDEKARKQKIIDDKEAEVKKAKIEQEEKEKTAKREAELIKATKRKVKEEQEKKEKEEQRKIKNAPDKEQLKMFIDNLKINAVPIFKNEEINSISLDIQNLIDKVVVFAEDKINKL